MALVNKPNTFTAGATIIAAQHNSNFDTIYNDYNGNITDANLATNAAITDTKLAQITTASKVSGTAITGLASLPSGAGLIPTANITVSTGSVVQVVNTQTGASSTGSTAMSVADAIPQNTAGDEYMTLAITPTSATNKLKIEVDAVASASAAGLVVMGLFQDSTAGALAASTMVGVASNPLTGHISYYMTAGTISATTFKVRIGNGAGATTTFNGSGGSRVLGGVANSGITITEIKA